MDRNIQIASNKPLKQIGNFIIELFNQIGHGSYGSIYTAYRKGFEQEIIVCKKIKLNSNQSMQIQEGDILLKKVKGRYIVEVISAFRTKTTLYIFMPYYREGDLEQYLLSHRQQMNLFDILLIFYKIVVGYYESIYQNNVIHRDIKLQNILMMNGDPHIGDFGVSKIVENCTIARRNTVIGSFFYQSPQISKVDENNEYSYKADIYSLGFPGQSKSSSDCLQFQKRLKEYGEVESIKFPNTQDNSLLQKEVQNLLLNMITFEEDDRIEIGELINHKVFKEIKENLNGDKFKQQIQNSTSTDLNLQQLKKKIIHDIKIGGENEQQIQKTQKYYQHIIDISQGLQDHLIYLGDLHSLFTDNFKVDEFYLDLLTLIALLFQEASIHWCKDLLLNSNQKIQKVPYHPDFFNSSLKHETEREVDECQKLVCIILNEVKKQLQIKINNESSNIFSIKASKSQDNSHKLELQSKLSSLLKYNKYDTKYLYQELKQIFTQLINQHKIIEQLKIIDYKNHGDLWRLLNFFICLFDGTFDIANYEKICVREYIQREESKIDEQFRQRIIQGLQGLNSSNKESQIQTNSNKSK